MRITPDTTVLIRTTAKATGPARELLAVIRQLDCRLVLSRFLLDEVQRVLRYPRVQAVYRLNDDDILEHARYLESLADMVSPFEGPPIVLKRSQRRPRSLCTGLKVLPTDTKGGIPSQGSRLNLWTNTAR